MIEKFFGISIWWQLFFLFLLLTATAGVTFHYTSQHYTAKIATLDATVSNKNEAIKVAGESIDKLVLAVEAQNKAFEELALQRRNERIAAKERLDALERTGRQLVVKIAGLEEKVKRPVVDVNTLTPEQIALEIGECRRSVEINNVAETGVLQ